MGKHNVDNHNLDYKALDGSYQEALLDAVTTDYNVQQAARIIKADYGDDISVYSKAKNLTKFGRSRKVDNTDLSTIMTLPGTELNETYISDNLIDTISSDNSADTQELVIEGHTIDGNGDFTFVSQTATLNGQNKVVLTTPMARLNRMYNNNGTELVGTIYGYQDDTITAGVPDTDTLVHCMIEAGRQQSQKAATTISKNDYWLVSEFYADVLEKQAAFAEVDLEVRFKNKVFRQRIEIASSSNGRAEHVFTPYFIVPPNSDVRLRAIGSSVNLDVSAGIQGFLAEII